MVVTRGHSHDKTVVEQVLKTNAGYARMIGSRRRTRVIFEALLKEGFSRGQLRRVHTPIGPPIGGEPPHEIAVSIVAEMTQVRNRKEDLSDLNGESIPLMWPLSITACSGLKQCAEV